MIAGRERPGDDHGFTGGLHAASTRSNRIPPRFTLAFADVPPGSPKNNSTVCPVQGETSIGPLFSSVLVDMNRASSAKTFVPAMPVETRSSAGSPLKVKSNENVAAFVGIGTGIQMHADAFEPSAAGNHQLHGLFLELQVVDRSFWFRIRGQGGFPFSGSPPLATSSGEAQSQK